MFSVGRFDREWAKNTIIDREYKLIRYASWNLEADWSVFRCLVVVSSSWFVNRCRLVLLFVEVRWDFVPAVVSTNHPHQLSVGDNFMKVGTGAVVVFFVSPSSSLLPIVSALSVFFTSSPTVYLHPHRHSASSSSSPACPLPIGFTTFQPLPPLLLRPSTGWLTVDFSSFIL